MKFVNIYWPLSDDDGEKTMSPRVTRTPWIRAIKDDQNNVYDEKWGDDW